MRLSLAVIRILSEDHDPDLVERGQIEGIQDIWSFRIDDMAGFFLLHQEFLDMREIRLGELISQDCFPRRIYLEISSIDQNTEKIVKLQYHDICEKFIS